MVRCVRLVKLPRCRSFSSFLKKFTIFLVKAAVLFIGIVVVANQLTYFRDRHVIPLPSRFRGKHDFVTTWPDSPTQPSGAHSSGVKTVLLWTKMFFTKDWGFKPSGGFEKCRVKNCRVTEDKNALLTSDALLFHTRNLFELRQDFPKQRREEQVWILHNLEPPYYVYDSLAPWAGLFNWTSSYRRDSDLYSPYGRSLPWSSASRQDPIDVWASKSRMVLFVASNCRDYARRYRVVDKLARLLPIDMYGNCHKLSCKKTSMCEKSFGRYKFFLAFENGYCRDYVTEKLWQAYARKQIPIVFGAVDYQSIAPPGSYIRAADFPSLETLAEYVLRVSHNATLYNSFFSWRRDFSTETLTFNMDWCGLCAALHDVTHRPRQVYSDPEGWMAEDTCPRYSYVDDALATVDLVMFYVGL